MPGYQPDPPAPADAVAPVDGQLPSGGDPDEVQDGVEEELLSEKDVLASGDAAGSADGSDVVATGVEEQSQSPWPYVAVGGLVLVLAAAGVYAARRYRQ